jgi:hypothetical protein
MIARNKFGISKDDLAEAFNNANCKHRITDIYNEKKWGIEDKVQTSVIEYTRHLIRQLTKITCRAAETRNELYRTQVTC